MLQAYIKTYGCQMNTQDSLQMGGMLRAAGYSLSSDPEGADVLLFVSCSVREKAVQKVYSDLGRARLLWEENPKIIVGISGCVAQQEKENLTKRFPFLDLVLGPDAIRNLPEIIAQVQKTKGGSEHKPFVQARFDARDDFAFVNLLPHEEETRIKAFVTIQKGCDNVCAFCIVPRVRGPEVSRSSNDILREVKELVSLGVKEVTLLGQNVNSYGLKNTGDIPFSKLVDRIATETKIERLRFVSSHPKDVGDDLVEQFAQHTTLCSHFHLPVQSGSDKILKAMRRDYTYSDYMLIIEKLKKARPDIEFTSDMIVGYPGETEEDFKESLRLMSEADYSLTYSYIYSPRPGTTSLRLDDDIPKEIKVERLARMQDLQREISRKQNEKLLNTTQSILVENEDDHEGVFVGRTSTNKIVHFQRNVKIDNEGSGNTLLGQTVNVRITRTNPFSLMGEMIS